MIFPPKGTQGCRTGVLMVVPKLFIKLGAKASFSALERERPQIVNNFAPSASPGYELSSSLAWMNRTRLSNQAGKLELIEEYSDADEWEPVPITSFHKDFLCDSSGAN